MRIRISWTGGEVTGSLNGTRTAHELYAALPCESRVSTWGEEVYFEVPLTMEIEEGARQVVPPGTICFWTQGNAVAIPYGPTPVSEGRECRLVTNVNVIGRLDDPPETLASLGPGTEVRVEALPD